MVDGIDSATVPGLRIVAEQWNGRRNVGEFELFADPQDPSPGGATIVPTYDRAGRLTSFGDTTIEYDVRGLASKFVTTNASGGVTVQDRVYDGDRQLVALTVTKPDGQVVEHRFVWDSVSSDVDLARIGDDLGVTTVGSKISGQMGSRGWSQNLIDDTLAQPSRTVITRDTRWTSAGTKLDDPATAYIRADGSYVVRNDLSGDIVQISNRNDANWIAPWD